MTERKPPDRSWESWVEEQIQNAQRDGEFDRLEGKGRPIPGIEEPYDPMWWVKKLLEREKLSVLPPALEVRARADRMLDEVWILPTETHVVDRVAADRRDAAVLDGQAAVAGGSAEAVDDARVLDHEVVGHVSVSPSHGVRARWPDGAGAIV